MKISSIIALIVGVAILVSGIILSSIATGMATSAGYDLQDGIEIIDGNIIREYAIPASYEESAVTERRVARVELDVRNVDVEIVGFYDIEAESRVVLYNMTFPRTSVIMTSNSIEITNIFRIDSLIDGGGQGLAFRGIRSLFTTGVFGQGGLLGPTGQQRVRIYLNNADRLNRLDLIVHNANVTVQDIAREMDINITATGGSEITLSDINSNASLEIDATDSTINMEAVTLSQANMELVNSNVVFDALGVELLYGYYVTADTEGTIIVNGVSLGGEYIDNNVEGYPLITVNQKGGTFEIRRPLGLTPPAPENDGGTGVE